MGPANENAGRGQWFRETLGKPATITALVASAAVALLAGAYFGGAPGAAGAPVGVVLVILVAAWWLADRKAEKLFWKHVGDSLGYQPFSDPTALETTTPLPTAASGSTS